MARLRGPSFVTAVLCPSDQHPGLACRLPPCAAPGTSHQAAAAEAAGAPDRMRLTRPVSARTTEPACTRDSDCGTSAACRNGECVDPCAVRGVCGQNALCQVVFSKARCSCPQCYVGQPSEVCRPDPTCGRNPERPVGPRTRCGADEDCPDSRVCQNSECVDPCFGYTLCPEEKKCMARDHVATCVCKYGISVNEKFEFVCAGPRIECRSDDDCASNLACFTGKCQNPCILQNPCPTNKRCDAVNHQPICMCAKECQSSVSLCLNDRGCSDNLACRSYQCIDPCEGFNCPEDRPCYVEDHKPICKFCPEGFSVDPIYGCMKGMRATCAFCVAGSGTTS